MSNSSDKLSLAICLAIIALAVIVLVVDARADSLTNPRPQDPNEHRPDDVPQSNSGPVVPPKPTPGIAELRNHPNPFNSTTTISFNLPGSSEAELRVYDILGREVDKINLGILDEGEQSIVWSSGSAETVELPTGIYFYRVIAGSARGTGKMLLIK